MSTTIPARSIVQYCRDNYKAHLDSADCLNMTSLAEDVEDEFGVDEECAQEFVFAFQCKLVVEGEINE